MSDTFDHEGDAWDSLNQEREDDLNGPPPSSNPLHFHTYLCMQNDVVYSTPKAIRVKLRQGKIQVWVPKKLLRYSGSKIYLWSTFYRTTHAENIKKAMQATVPKIYHSIEEASDADMREIQHNNVGEIL